MPGDEPIRKGPRHAAPRRPILTRLHLPGGRIAFLAMPSALLLGIGLTPQLAQAQPGKADIPFREGPCVTAPDRDPEEEPDKDAEEDAGDGSGDGSGEAPEEGSDEAADRGAGQDSGEDGARPGGGTSGGGTSGPGGGGDGGSGGTPSPEPTPTPTPEPEPSFNPLDPLGIGEKLKDLFNPDRNKDKDQQPADREEPAKEQPQQDAAPGGDTGSTDKNDKEAAEEAARAKAEQAAKAERAAREQAAKVEEAAERAAEEKARAERETAAEKAAQGGQDAEGKQPFPCPEYDAEAYANADGEQTPALVPDDPFRLETTRLGLAGLKYHGIVKVRTYGGTEKRVLKFTAARVDIKDLHQIVVGPAGKSQHVRSTPGSTSTFRNGTVTMYTEELKGNLFGLIPITFSPTSPPPLDVPAAFFTDCTVVQAGQFGGDLTVPGLDLTYSDD